METQPAKHVTGPSERQTPLRQSLSVCAAQESPAPPSAVAAAGVKLQMPRTLACGLSAGRNEGVQ
ncbi:MAG: hypothetical protein E6J88_14245 [Deltaproteobacteria bacterium]|nr:MAG: hypothetical protein E6J88_14245 [Deltaproteobacteria bacterium]